MARLLLLLLVLLPTGHAARVYGWPDPAPTAPTGQSAPGDAAVLIGVEGYDTLPTVPYAQRDAQAMAAWLRLGRGVPGHRVRLLLDPDTDEVVRAIEAGLEQVGQDGTLWVGFSGHGVTDPSEGDHLLLAADASSEAGFSLTSPLSIEALQHRFTEDDAGRVMLIVDAGFSGLARGGESITGYASATPPPPPPRRPGVVTWLAAEGTEWAGPLEEARLGLFTWHVVAALRGWADGVDTEPDGRLTLEEAQRWVRQRMIATERGQTPAVDPRPTARAWDLGPVPERPPALQQDRPSRPMYAPSVVRPGPHAMSRRGPPDPTDAVEVEAALRRANMQRVEAAWARAYGRALRGDLDGLRLFLDQYGTVRFWHRESMRMFEFVAPQVPMARRMLANGGRPAEPLIRTVEIAPGPATLGSPVGTPGRAAGETLTEARLTRRIAVGVTEVTRSQWVTVMGASPVETLAPSHPVVGMTWQQAVQFCNRLSSLDGFDPAYRLDGTQWRVDPDASGWRLPTEAEWMAAAADVRTDGVPCRRANLADRQATDDPLACDDGYAGLSPVTAFRPDLRGLHGLWGNAAEWTDDGWHPLPGRPVVDPRPPATRDRVVKGGSHLIAPEDARLAARAAQRADEPRNDLGLRVVRTLPPVEDPERR